MNDQIHSCSYFCDRPACVKAQRDELRDKQLKGYQRYETVRKMSLRAFGEAYHENLSSGKPFDEIIDELYGVYFPNAEVSGSSTRPPG
jgi:hypothetical protein